MVAEELIGLQGVSVEGRASDLHLRIDTGFRGVVRGSTGDLAAAYALLVGRVAPTVGQVVMFGRAHPGARIRERRWCARVGFAHGEGHLVENISIRRNLALPLRYVLGVSGRRAAELVESFVERMSIRPWADLRPAQAPMHVRQIAHIGRAVIPDREVVVLLDPQEGMAEGAASEVLGTMMANVRTAVILCSERWLPPPDGFVELQLRSPS